MTVLAIEARGLRFAHVRGRPVLDGVDLQVSKGEMWGVFGANGAGKTTLLHILAGVLARQEGRVSVEGASLDALSSRERACRVALVPQVASFAFSHTVLEAVLMARAPRLGRLALEGAHDLDVARAALVRLGLHELEARPVSTLSGGEARRVLLARALAQETSIILLDEPEANLDIRHRLEAYRLLRDLALLEGKALVLVSHDLSLAASYVTHAALLHEARLAASGPAAEALEEETLSRVFGVGMRVLVEDGRVAVRYEVG